MRPFGCKARSRLLKPRMNPDCRRNRMPVTPDASPFESRLATSAQDILAAQRLRYRVFVEELGGDGPLVDHAGRFERDEFDAANDHLILVDTRRDPAALDHVVGVYRLLRSDQAAAFGRFYCDAEYDLTALRTSGRRLLELGRSCVEAEHRGGTAMFLLWSALADYVLEHGVEVLFGVASFHGTDIDALRMPLAWLHHKHLAPEALRVRALPEHFQTMDLVPAANLDQRAAMLAIPALIKAYLRLGGFVGEGAFIDRAFNTTDVCLLMDTAEMSARHKGFYTRKHEARV
jgi:L-ornithine Nalpha-acyltransferase